MFAGMGFWARMRSASWGRRDIIVRQSLGEGNIIMIKNSFAGRIAKVGHQGQEIAEALAGMGYIRQVTSSVMRVQARHQNQKLILCIININAGQIASGVLGAGAGME